MLTVIAAESARLAREHLNNLREAHPYRLDDASVARVISTWEVTRDDLTSCSRNRVAGGNSRHAVAGGKPGVETALSSPRNAASSRTSSPSSTSYGPSRSNVYSGSELQRYRTPRRDDAAAPVRCRDAGGVSQR